MVKEFESFCSDYLNVKHAISCTSWTTGAELVFRAIGLEENQEVICSDFSHPLGVRVPASRYSGVGVLTIPSFFRLGSE